MTILYIANVFIKLFAKYDLKSADHGEAFLRNYDEYMDAIGRIIKK